MTDKMVNGIMFIVAGLGSIAAYMILGETGILDKSHTEKIAAYGLITIPLAFMMTRKVVKNTFLDSGLLVKIVGLTMGLISDAINSAELGAESKSIGEVIAWTAWSIMYFGIFLSGLGYLRTNLFPQWLSGLLAVAAFAFFAFIAILNGEQLANNEDLIAPLWMANSIVLVIMGIFTIRRTGKKSK